MSYAGLGLSGIGGSGLGLREGAFRVFGCPLPMQV